MVTCGKVLIASPSNDSLIDLLMSQDISVNSIDQYGMTAMHYASQNFYIYRKEPLDLIEKLLTCGADLNLVDQSGETSYSTGIRHGNKDIIYNGKALVKKLTAWTVAQHCISRVLSSVVYRDIKSPIIGHSQARPSSQLHSIVPTTPSRVRLAAAEEETDVRPKNICPE